MIKRVESDQELAYFHYIWMTAWREKGFAFEFAEDVLDRYLVIGPDGSFVGTSEYRSFDPRTSAFANLIGPQVTLDLQLDPTEVAEIDKFAILPEYRGKIVKELIWSGILTARERGIRYFVSLLDPIFYRALRITYRAPITVVGPKSFYKGDYVLPVVIAIHEMAENPAKFGIAEPAAPFATSYV